MKALLCLIFPIILLVGYGQPDLDDPKVLDVILDEAVHLNSLQRKGSRGKESFYDPNKDYSYTGWAKLMHPNGKLHFLMYLNNGKPDGICSGWYDNGRKMVEGNYNNGKVLSIKGWKHNGEKCPKAQMIDGKVASYQIYSKDGTVRSAGILPNY